MKQVILKNGLPVNLEIIKKETGETVVDFSFNFPSDDTYEYFNNLFLEAKRSDEPLTEKCKVNIFDNRAYSKFHEDKYEVSMEQVKDFIKTPEELINIIVNRLNNNIDKSVAEKSASKTITSSYVLSSRDVSLNIRFTEEYKFQAGTWQCTITMFLPEEPEPQKWIDNMKRAKYLNHYLADMYTLTLRGTSFLADFWGQSDPGIPGYVYENCHYELQKLTINDFDVVKKNVDAIKKDTLDDLQRVLDKNVFYYDCIPDKVTEININNKRIQIRRNFEYNSYHNLFDVNVYFIVPARPDGKLDRDIAFLVDDLSDSAFRSPLMVEEIESKGVFSNKDSTLTLYLGSFEYQINKIPFEYRKRVNGLYEYADMRSERFAKRIERKILNRYKQKMLEEAR